jgi:hypothetical protein
MVAEQQSNLGKQQAALEGSTTTSLGSRTGRLEQAGYVGDI